MEAVARAVAAKGYAHTTIADIVRQARVSKRTFYESFADKEACFLAACDRLSARVLESIARAAALEHDLVARLEAAAHAYVTALEEDPAITRALLVEIHAAGPGALSQRRVILERFATLLRGLVDAAREQQPELSALSPAMATALVGGINELLLLRVEEGRARFGEVGRTAVQLVTAAVARPALSPKVHATRPRQVQRTAPKPNRR